MKRVILFVVKQLVIDYKNSRDYDIFDHLIDTIKEKLETEIKIIERLNEVLTIDVDVDAPNDKLSNLIWDILDLNANEQNGVNVAVFKIDVANLKQKGDLEPLTVREANGKEFNDFVCKINELKSLLEEKVLGQQYAINKVIGGLLNTKTVVKEKDNYPLACFTLTGPHGVGKSYIAELVAHFYETELDIPCNIFTRADYPDEKFMNKLNRFVTRNPECIIVLNDAEDLGNAIEADLFNILNSGEVDGVSYRNVIFFLTTYIGEKIYSNSVSGNLSNVSFQQIYDSLLNETVNDSNIGGLRSRTVKGLAKGKLLMLNFLESNALKEIVIDSLESKFNEFTNNTNIQVKYNKEQLAATILYMNKREYNAKGVINFLQYFIEKELNEIFMLVNSQSSMPLFTELSDIKFTIDVTHSPVEVKELYKERTLNALIICNKKDQETFSNCKLKNINLLFADNVEDAKKVLGNRIDFIILDVLLKEKKMKYLPTNIEDYVSDGMELYNFITTYYNEFPLYVMKPFSSEEAYDNYLPLLNGSCKDIVEFNPQKIHLIEKQLNHIQRDIELTCDITTLINQNRSLSYNSSQIVTNDGKSLEVRLTKLSLTYNEYHVKNGKLKTNYSTVKFSDVIGNDNAKKILGSYIDFLKNTKKFIESGARAPKGLLLYGEAETGKTILVEALAGEAGVTLLHYNASEILLENHYLLPDVFKKIHELFETAKENSPSILLIDDIDEILIDRNETLMDQATKLICNEMDKVNSDPKHPVLFVITSSAYKDDFSEKLIKKLDRCIGVTLPNEKEREEYIRVSLSRHNITTISDSVIHNFALRMFGSPLSYVDTIIDFVIKNSYGKEIKDKDLIDAIDLYNNGEEVTWSDEDRLSTAYHEMGHALINILLGNHPSFVTIVSRGYYGGYTMPDTHEDDHHKGTKKYYLDDICCSFGGRAAEYIVYGEDGINSGISGDIRQATKKAIYMVGFFGMGETLYVTSYADAGKLPDKVLEQVDKILHEQYDRAIHILTENRSLLDYLAKLLFEKNSLTGEEVEKAIEDFKNNQK